MTYTLATINTQTDNPHYNTLTLSSSTVTTDSLN